MKTRKWINISLMIITFLLLCLFASQTLNLIAGEQTVELKLIKEEKLDITPDTEITFLGNPEITGSGQARFASILLTRYENKQNFVRVDGTDILIKFSLMNEENRFIYSISYSEGTIGYLQREYIPEERRFIKKFICQKLDGDIVWEFERDCDMEIHFSRMGTVFIVCKPSFEHSQGPYGIYLYDLSNGRLLNSFEGLNMDIGKIALSGDKNRLFFLYRYSDVDMDESVPYPRQRIACMDANGKMLWDIETLAIRSMSISYQGDRVLYVSESPSTILEGKFGNKTYEKVGLINENGGIIWEVDKPTKGGVFLVPSGDYYYTSLYSDQLNIWDVATKSDILDPTVDKGEIYHCLFESRTHKNVWREELKKLVPQLDQGWYTRDIGDISLDNQWSVLGFSNIQLGSQIRENESSIRSLLILKKFLTRETVHQQEFSGDIIKGLTSPDVKLIDLIFADGRRILLQRIP